MSDLFIKCRRRASERVENWSFDGRDEDLEDDLVARRAEELEADDVGEPGRVAGNGRVRRGEVLEEAELVRGAQRDERRREAAVLHEAYTISLGAGTRTPSYTDRVLLLSQPGKPPLRRLAQGTAGDGRDGRPPWTESDHQPVWSVFGGVYMLPAAAVLDEGFEETWLLCLTSLQVRVAIGALREGHGDATAEGGWEHLCGDRLPMTELTPLLSATLTASFLSR